MTALQATWAGRQISRVRQAPHRIRNVGLLNWLQYQLKVRGLLPSPERLMAKGVRLPLVCRPRTSDRYVFHQIFVEREYSCLDHLAVSQVGLVIDCGANVGYSSAYFLSRFPNARVLAVEPDSDNFAILCQNLRAYGDRVTPINSGVWSRPCGLVMAEDKFGDGLEWARHVRPVRDGEVAQMIATDIGSLLAGSGFDRISILKVDVEGAEAVIFGEGSAAWVGRCDSIVAELHGPHCEKVFHEAIAGLPFRVSRSGELTVCTRY